LQWCFLFLLDENKLAYQIEFSFKLLEVKFDSFLSGTKIKMFWNKHALAT